MRTIQENENGIVPAATLGGPARLYALQLCLRPLQSGTLMPFSGELVHGAFLHWLGASAPEVTEWLHQRQRQRLFTCSSLRFNRPAHAMLKAERENIHLPLDPRETYTIRITLLLGGLFPLFHQALTSFDPAHLSSDTPPFLRLGNQFFLLKDVLITKDNPDSWAGFTSLANLVEQARQISGRRASTLTLDFASLTAFNYGNSSIPYDTYPLMLPLPQLVFQNLARRWQHLAPAELADVIQTEDLERYLQEEGAIIVDYHLTAHHVHFATHRQRGFIGSCTYQLRGPDERATPNAPLTLGQQIHLLAYLAFYTGVGYKTPMGLGQVRMRA